MKPLITVEALASARPMPHLCDLRWDLTDPDKGKTTYEAGHIPGAVFVDLDRDLAGPSGISGRHPLPDPAEFAAILGRLGIAPDSHVVVYDDVAGRIAARLWWMLRSIGHERVQVLDGGYRAWVRAGHAVDVGSATPEPATYPVPDGFTGVVDHDQLDGRAVVDARAPERYLGETEPVDPKAGHIPGAVNIPTSENLSEDDRFRSSTELAHLYDGLPDRPVVSCGSGVTACHDALAMVAAGRDMPDVYVGSFSEWSRRDLPVATGPNPVISQRAIEAIEYSDTDELLRVVDGLCENGEWDELVELKTRCREAVGRGKQLWGVEEHIRYRLTLQAPARWAGTAVSEGVARFTLGPLPEVAASTKTWSELDPHLDDGPWRAVTAAERVVRGDSGTDPIADLPNRLVEWEPDYPLATYKPDKVEAPSPSPPSVEEVDLPADFSRIDDPQSEGALFDLVQPWVTESNGRCEIAAVEGDARAAIRALGLTRARVGGLNHREALRWMAWAGASGGAHGRRRGAAAGRYGVWWAIATFCDLDWPPDPDEIGWALQNLTFYWFDDGSPGTGWELRLAVEDARSGLAWAASAVDSAD